MTSDLVTEAIGQALALARVGKVEDGIAALRRLTVEHPGHARAWSNLGALLGARQRYADVVDVLQIAASLEPDLAWTWGRLGAALHATRRLEEARRAYERALALGDNPVDRFSLGMLLLTLGEYERGWALHESRRDDPNYPGLRLPFPEWSGEPLAGKRLLIWPEHGFGDQIQFARYAKLAQSQGARVTIAAPPDLADLFRTLGVEVLIAEGDLQLATPDFWCPIMSLPRHFKTDATSIPGAPYLSVPAERLEKWAGKVPPGRIGLVHRGRPTHPNDAERSLPSPEVLMPLKDQGAVFYDLQAPKGDFADTAAIISQLDLVITVDTATAHLAGALGVRCWVMLPWLQPDWRWGVSGDRTPWYPSLRLFRQSAQGDWTSVVAEMVAARRGLKRWPET